MKNIYILIVVFAFTCLAQSPVLSMQQLKDLAENGMRGRVESLEEGAAESFISAPFRQSHEAVAGVVSIARLRRQIPKESKNAFNRARRWSDADNHQKAAEELEKAVDLDPGFVEAHGNLGIEYAGLGRYFAAEGEFRRSIALDPSSSTRSYNLAMLLCQLGRVQEAEKSVRQALNLSPRNAEAHFLLRYLLSSSPDTRAQEAANILKSLQSKK